MKIVNHDNKSVSILGGGVELRLNYSPMDSAPGELSVRLQDPSTLDETAVVAVRLDPWHADGFEVFDWMAGQGVILCGGRRVLSLTTKPLAVASTVWLEYEEGETLESPWFVASAERAFVATERRIWCLDERMVMRWMWSARAQERQRWIREPPSVFGGMLHVPVRTRLSDAVIHLSVDDGAES